MCVLPSLLQCRGCCLSIHCHLIHNCRLVSCCAHQVHRKMARASRDIRFDDVLANACQEDRKQYCSDVQPVGSGA